MSTTKYKEWAQIQQVLGIDADGIPGVKTAEAVATKLGIQLSPGAQWPTQAEVRRGSSIFGKPGEESNLEMINFPYPMYYEGKEVLKTRVHKRIASAVVRIFKKTLDHYGLGEIKRLGLDQYGGCYNYRATVSGSSLSMHAWGIAFDLDPARNGYAAKKPKAALSHKDCEAFWRFVEEEGAVSLGRERDYDWMHFQFARL